MATPAPEGVVAMFARVTELASAYEPELDQDLRYFENEILPKAEEIPGMSGGLVLLDRAGGRALAVTLWADRAALEESREEADTLRELAFQRMNLASAPVVREYEVAIASLLRPVHPVRSS
jgi:hypothetical protein